MTILVCCKSTGFDIVRLRIAQWDGMGCDLMSWQAQGHTLWSRQAGSSYPCPQVDFTGGFNAFLAEAYNLNGQSIEQHFGKAFGEMQRV